MLIGQHAAINHDTGCERSRAGGGDTQGGDNHKSVRDRWESLEAVMLLSVQATLLLVTSDYHVNAIKKTTSGNKD